MTEPARIFPKAVKSVRGEEPLLIGCVGPPGGGKTVSSLRLAAGMKTVRGGPIVLIDTEGGRSKKYSGDFDFLRVDFPPPFRSHDFLAAIKQQLPLGPSAIIVDSMSDEHEGEDGYLEWHEEMVPQMGGNEWAAWAKPAASRKRLISGVLQIKVPLLFTFRAREKTAQKQKQGSNKKEIINIGWMPVAPLEIVHALDLTCILPPRANGVPVWRSEKIGEDFIVKLPSFLAGCIREGALSEETGAALAKWAAGEATPAADLLSAIRDALAAAFPGQAPAAKAARLGLMQGAFGVDSWKEVCALPPEKLRDGLPKIKGGGTLASGDPPETGGDAHLDYLAVRKLYDDLVALGVNANEVPAHLAQEYGSEDTIPASAREAILAWGRERVKG